MIFIVYNTSKTQAVFCAVLYQQEKGKTKQHTQKKSQTARWHSSVRRVPVACHAKVLNR